MRVVHGHALLVIVLDEIQLLLLWEYLKFFDLIAVRIRLRKSDQVANYVLLQYCNRRLFFRMI